MIYALTGVMIGATLCRVVVVSAVSATISGSLQGVEK